MNAILAIAAGGAVGALLRHFSSFFWLKTAGGAFPYGTLFVNVAGAFMIGLVIELGTLKWHMPLEARYFLVTGVLGAFTTFSAFSLDVFKLVETGQATVAIVYVLLSVILSLSAVFGDVYLLRGVM